MLKRTVATLASAAVLALLITPSAEAAGPDQLSGYAAGSSATALAITLLDQEIALSSTSAAVSSEGPQEGTAGPTASSDGAALLVAGTPVPNGAPSQTPGGQPSNSVSVANADLGDLTSGAADGLALEIARVDTTATVTDGAPAATSESDETVIAVNGLSGDVLDPVLDALVPVLTDTLTQATDPVIDAVCGLLADQLCDDQGIVDLDAAVAELIADIDSLDEETFTVAQVRVGPTVSRASADDTNGVVAQAGSTAVFVELFPGLASGIDEVTGLIPNAAIDDALLTVELGNATAQVVRHPVTGAPAPDASAAQLLSIDLTDSLGILSSLLSEDVPALVDTLAAAGAALSCEDGALKDIVCVDLGAVNELDEAELAARGYDFGEGTVGREATAAGIAVLPILGELLGGESVLGLQLAQASAAANAVPAEAPAPPPSPRGPLPRTGGTPSLPVVLGLFGAAAVGVAAIRRTRTV
jgi:hypothetical protein